MEAVSLSSLPDLIITDHLTPHLHVDQSAAPTRTPTLTSIALKQDSAAIGSTWLLLPPRR